MCGNAAVAACLGVLARVGVMSSEAGRSSFATKHLEQDLARLRAEEQCCFLAAHELLNVLVCSARTQFSVPSAWLRVCQGVAFLPACVCRSAWLLACSHKLQQLSLALEKISYLCQTCAITRVVRVSPILWHCLMQSSSVKQDSVAPLPPPVLTQLWCIALFLCCLLLP